MTHWREVHKRKTPGLLYAEMLGERGTKRVVRTASSGEVVLQDATEHADAEAMPFVVFDNSPLKLGLNRTNCKALETITGSGHYEDWGKGVWVVLTVIRTKYPDKQTKQRLETDAIRIAPAPPSADEIKAELQRRETSSKPQGPKPQGPK